MRLSAKRFVLCAMFGIAIVGCKEKPPDSLEGSGVSAEASRNVAPFSRLSVGSRVEAEVTIGPPSPLVLQGDGNLLPHVTSRSENGLLTLDTDVKIKPSMRLRARITVPRLESVSGTKGARIDIQGLAADAFEAHAADGAKMRVAGTARILVLEGKGAGFLDFAKVPAGSATVRLERGARAEVGYLEKLDAKLFGASSLSYEGTPEIKKEIQYPSRLTRRDH